MSILNKLSLRRSITEQPYPEHFLERLAKTSETSEIINTSKRLNTQLNQSEKEALTSIIDALENQQQLTSEIISQTDATSKRLFKTISSKRKQQASFFEDWVAEYGLNNNEGLILLKLTECFLRAHQSPLALTLVEDFIFQANWKTHFFHSKSTAVNLSTLFLDFGTKLLSSYESIATNHQVVHETLEKIGAPLVIRIIKSLLVQLANTFVCGETIQEAVEKSQSLTHQQFAQSFDMLGEAALTLEEADKYYESYLNALKYLADQKTQAFVHTPALSIKLSALEPRYEPKHWRIARKRLIPRLKTLFALADEHGIAVTLDAEESWRQEIHLDALKESLLALNIKTPYLIGTAVQAYQTRSPQVIEDLIEFCQSNQIQLHIRLVKGAYWDSEIKYCQQAGLKEYTVFTNKTLTDLNYLRCAARLLEKPELIYPQFATHNIATIASILVLTKKFNTQAFEFQKLYGMGDAIHQGLQEEYDTLTRVYSPVGEHDQLLPYLVRRILENGVNSSFLNGFNQHENIELTHPYSHLCELCEDDFENLDNICIKAPPNIYLPERKNSPSSGLEFMSHRHNIFQLWQGVMPKYQHKIYSIVGGKEVVADENSASNFKSIISPAVSNTTIGDVQTLNSLHANSG